MKFIFQWSCGDFLCPNFHGGHLIWNNWKWKSYWDWAFQIPDKLVDPLFWLVVTLRLEVQTQALAICISVAANLLKYEFEFLVLCWESYFINLNKGGAVLFWGGLLMQLVAADTDSGITQMLKRSSCPGWKFDGNFFSLIFEMGVEEFPRLLSVLVQV